MTSAIHAAEWQYSLDGAGYIRLKVFVAKKISPMNLKSKPVFVIRTELRVSIYNTNDFYISPSVVTAYKNYPALFQFSKSIQCLDGNEEGNFGLLSYTPITVNSSINTSRSDTTDNQLTNSSQQSVGSSSSQTNSFGVSVQAGEMMEMPMWSVGFSYEHAFTAAESKERSTGASNTAGQQLSYGDSYSIKDWGLYAFVNRENLQTSWICAQEYPWDILQFRSAEGDGTIELPKAIIDRMLVGDCVLPPSQLSQFGTEFTFAAEWRFTPSQENVDVDTALLSVDINTAFVHASHERKLLPTGKYTLAARIGPVVSDPRSMQLTWWDLECLALNPVVPGRNDASLNLEKLPSRRFPTDSTTPLTVTSPTNTLLCVAAGFSEGMIADVAAASATFSLAFKVTSTVGEINLYLKHWKVDETGIEVLIEVNDRKLPVQLVDAKQGGGGMGNRMDIALRTTDYMAEDFCDYLVVGLNVIKVTVSAADASSPPASARYCLAAIVVS